MSERFRYKAFISYSHHDRRRAARIFNGLETYKLPTSLRRQAHLSIGKNGRLGTFFRDRDELPAAADLGDKITAALQVSEFLIVICSPAAANSPWVNKEIIEFKRLHGEDNILAVIIEGESNSSQKDKYKEGFPKALKYRIDPNGQLSSVLAEPLAADFRNQADGERLGRLKLISALTGIDLARLADRDQARRQKTVTAITGASLFLMLIMSGLAYFAYDARKIAEQRRQGAEELIEFMINDLKYKLEEVGRLDILNSIAINAQKYYDNQPIGYMDSDSIRRRSRVLHNLGNVAMLEGNYKLAEEYFYEAYLATESLLERNQSVQNDIFEHGQSAFWVGYIHWQQLDYTKANYYWEIYLTLSKKLVSLDKDNIKWRRELAYAHSNMGTYYSSNTDNFDPRKALDYFLQALEEFKRVAQANDFDTKSMLDLADAYAWVSDMSVYSDTIDVAKSMRFKVREIYIDQEKKTTNQVHAIELNKLRNESALLKLSLLSNSDYDYNKSKLLVRVEGLISTDPTRVDSLKLAILAYSRLAEYCLWMDCKEFNVVELLAVANSYTDILAKQVSIDGVARKSDYLLGQIEILLLYTDYEMRKGTFEDVENKLNTAYKYLEEHKITLKGKFYRRIYSKLISNYTEYYNRTSNQESALNSAQKLLNQFSGDYDTITPEIKFDLYKACVALNKLECEQELAVALEKSRFSHPEYIEIKNKKRGERDE